MALLRAKNETDSNIVNNKFCRFPTYNEIVGHNRHNRCKILSVLDSKKLGFSYTDI